MTLEDIELNHPYALKCDGHDNAIIGTAERCGMTTVIAYDSSKIISNLQEQGMTYEEAVEFYDFNIAGAYVGEHTPVFINSITEE